MSNITTSSGTGGVFIPQLLSNKALQIFRKKIRLARIATRDNELDGSFTKGQTIEVQRRSTFTATQKQENTLATVQNPSNTKIPVTLNRHFNVDFIVEDLAQSFANQSLIRAHVEPAMEALAVQVETDLFALYTGFSKSVGTGASNTVMTLSLIQQATKSLNDDSVPEEDRFLIHSTMDGFKLKSDTQLMNYIAQSRPEKLEEGTWGKLDGFWLMESTMVPAATDIRQNLALHRSGICLAVRPLATDPIALRTVEVAYAVDEESGLVIRMIIDYSAGHRGVYVGFDILYGVAELRDESVVRVLTDQTPA